MTRGSHHTPVLPIDAVMRKLARFEINVETGRIYNAKGLEIFTGITDGYHRMQIYYGTPRRARVIKRCHAVWWKHYSEWPKNPLDHEDRDRSNDRIDNLRPTTMQLNAINSAPSDRDLPVGVYLNKRMRARPYFTMHQNKHIGFFATPEAARHAYLQHTGEL